MGISFSTSVDVTEGEAHKIRVTVGIDLQAKHVGLGTRGTLCPRGLAPTRPAPRGHEDSKGRSGSLSSPMPSG
jgi:hypothetical protein